MIFYVIPKKSYLISCKLIWACTFIRVTRVICNYLEVVVVVVLVEDWLAPALALDDPDDDDEPREFVTVVRMKGVN